MTRERERQRGDRDGDHQRKRRFPCVSSCFPAGTLVATDRGLEPIETITKDRRVWAYDVWTGTWRLDTAAETFRRDYAGTVVTLKTPAEQIETTARHPFWVVAGRDLDQRPLTEELGDDNHIPAANGRWVEAQFVEPGDTLLSRETGETPVKSVETNTDAFPVFNLQIAECRSYAVGRSLALVHNASPCPEGEKLAKKLKYEDAPEGYYWAAEKGDAKPQLKQLDPKNPKTPPLQYDEANRRFFQDAISAPKDFPDVVDELIRTRRKRVSNDPRFRGTATGAAESAGRADALIQTTPLQQGNANAVTVTKVKNADGEALTLVAKNGVQPVPQRHLQPHETQVPGYGPSAAGYHSEVNTTVYLDEINAGKPQNKKFVIVEGGSATSSKTPNRVCEEQCVPLMQQGHGLHVDEDKFWRIPKPRNK